MLCLTISPDWLIRVCCSLVRIHKMEIAFSAPSGEGRGNSFQNVQRWILPFLQRIPKRSRGGFRENQSLFFWWLFEGVEWQLIIVAIPNKRRIPERLLKFWDDPDGLWLGHRLLLLIFQNPALNLARNINIQERNVKHSSWPVNNLVSGSHCTCTGKARSGKSNLSRPRAVCVFH